MSIGPLRVLHQLGAGALGPVYRGHDVDADRLVAIKVFRLDLTPEQSRDLARGLKGLVVQLSPHPAIAAPLAAGLEGGSAYLAVQYVAADSLDAWIRRRGATGLVGALPILRQVAAALDAAASAGVRHGALHPRDVLVTTTGEVAVTGLGVVDAVEAVGGRVAPRRPYAPPERAAGRGWDRRVDVYALAMMAAELVSGRQPVGSGAVVAAQLDIDEAGVDAGALRRALAPALDERPEHRPGTATALVEALEGAVVGDDLPLFDAPRSAPPAEAEVRLRETADDTPPGDDLSLVSAEPGEAAAATATAEARDEEGALETAVPELVDGVAGEPPSIRVDAPPVLPPEPVSPAASPPRPADPGGERPPLPRDVRLPREPWPPPAEGGPAPGRAGLRRHALTLALGFALGLGAGYAVWGRGAAPSGARAGAERPAPAVSVQVARPGGAASTGARAEPGPGAAAPAGPRSVGPAPSSPTVEPGRGATAPAGRQEGQGPAPAPAGRGRLRVRSEPTGARVSVNGRRRGTTPLELRGLRPGTYEILVERPGHLPASGRVTITERAPVASFAPRLRAAPAPAPAVTSGALDVVSRPAGARVSLDGQAVGLTPLRLADLAPRAYAMRLELAGHRPWSTTVRVVAGETARVAASLEPDIPR